MRGLNKLYWLDIEIKNLTDEINNLPMISSPQVTGIPRGSGKSEPPAEYTLKKEYLEGKLKQAEAKHDSEFKRITAIIDQIDDPSIQEIARLRLIHYMKWEDIGERVYLDRTNCARKLKKYIKNMDI